MCLVSVQRRRARSTLPCGGGVCHDLANVPFNPELFVTHVKKKNIYIYGIDLPIETSRRHEGVIKRQAPSNDTDMLGVCCLIQKLPVFDGCSAANTLAKQNANLINEHSKFYIY